MWNPLAYLDYNNLWRTMDEMGKEVWHEHCSWISPACPHEGQREGTGVRQAELLCREQTQCCQEQPHILMGRAHLRVASWQALLSPVLLRLSAHIPLFMWLWECHSLCLWLIFATFPDDLVSNILRGLQNSSICPFLPWNSTCVEFILVLF